MAIIGTIPVCKMCGAALYDKPQLFYDKRRKYCKVCAEYRKRTQDAQRMKEKRKEIRNERTEKINSLEIENEILKERCQNLLTENTLLRKQIIKLREGNNNV